jgi:hypothetical protein
MEKTAGAPNPLRALHRAGAGVEAVSRAARERQAAVLRRSRRAT